MIDKETHSSDFPQEGALDPAKSMLAALDNSRLSGFHLKAMITSGMGFFTDAYDLFIIGVVLAILTPLWHLSALDISLLGSTSLIAAAIGSVIFGRLADHLGRKFIYGYELMVLAIGAIASALSPSQMIAAMVSLVLGVSLFLLSFLPNQIPGPIPWQAQLLSCFALLEHMHDFARGVVDTRPVIVYFSLTAFFLFLTLRAVESRRWK